MASFLVAGALVLASPVGAAPEAPHFLAVGTLARVPRSMSELGPLSPSKVLSVGISLAPRNATELSSYADAVSTPGNPLFHRFLSAGQFAARFAPSVSTVNRVEKALRGLGLHIGPVPADRLIVPVTASAGALEQALRTSLVAYRLPSGSVGWAASIVPELPRSVAGAASSVIGLDQLASPKALISSGARPTAREISAISHSASPTACKAATETAQSSSGWTQEQIADAYGLDRLYAKGDLAQGQTIAIFELEPFLDSDVATFDRCFFGSGHIPAISTQTVDGFDQVGAGTGEATLDIENVSALAPDAHLLVYEAPNTTFGTIDEYAAIVSEDRANIISTSWGECEEALALGAPGSTQVENTLFEEAAAQGQTVFAAAGDDGSDDCANTPFSSTVPVSPYLSVDDPGAQPYVVSVGGTSLTTDRQPLGPRAETVWNDGAQGGGGGGGISADWPIPSWQADSGVPGVGTSGNREVPDVSAAADQLRGVTIYTSGYAPPLPGGTSQVHPMSSTGGWTTIGGTSSAAPIWAAIAAEIAASGSSGTSCGDLPVTAGGADLGFISPELYAVAGSAYTSTFNDVRAGSNDVFSLGEGYSAGPGYDLASGLGSPEVTNPSGPGLASYLCADATSTSVSVPARPVITSISPSSGPVGGGGLLSVDLASPLPPGASVHAQVGSAAARVVSSGGTSVELTVPAATLTISSEGFAGAGPAAVSIGVTTSSGSAWSDENSAATYQYLAVGGSGNGPTVTGVGPDGGNVAGGNTVLVYGSGFGSGPVAVSFGGVPAEGIDVLSDDELSVVVPALSGATSCSSGLGFDPGDACQVEVVVTTPDGTSPTAAILPALSGPVVFDPEGVVESTPEEEVAPATTEYDYGPTPVITSISPDPADATGNQAVTILGHGFSLNTLDWVNFGPATTNQSQQVEISYISGSEIQIDPPPADGSGLVGLRGGVSVQSAAGLSDVEPFAYAGIPTVKRLSRRVGPATGGTLVTITGKDMTGVTSVDFITESVGGLFSESTSGDLIRRTPTRVTVLTPAAQAGVVDVEPCTPTGCSRADPGADRFVFYSVSPPVLRSVRPAIGPAAGGTIVVVTGSNLAGALEVRFGSRLSHRFVRPNGYPLGNPTVIAVVAPPGKAGSTVAVTVVTRAGKTPASPGARFSYD